MDLEEELAEVVKSSSEVNNGSLSKMGFTKINGFWVSKSGDPAASSSRVQVEDEDEDAEEPAAAENARPTADIVEERITSMTSFERLVINRMDSLAENQNNLLELCQNMFKLFDEKFQGMDARFLNLDEQIEVVHNQLFKLQYGKEE